MPKAYELPSPGEPFDPELFKLGQPCKRNHIHADGLTLRWRKRKVCCLCERIDAKERMADRRASDPDYNRKAAAYVAQKRAREGRAYRGKHSKQWHELKRLHATIARAGRVTVQTLVAREQQIYWKEHPQAYQAELLSSQKKRQVDLYRTDVAYRLYQSAKRGAQRHRQNGGVAINIPTQALMARWREQGARCAYCCNPCLPGVDHVVPLSRGGSHDMSNILLSCWSCNRQKRTADMAAWYRGQSFYSAKRFSQLIQILGGAAGCVVTDESVSDPPPSPFQLAIPLPPVALGPSGAI